jgi:hypothetical protein
VLSAKEKRRAYMKAYHEKHKLREKEARRLRMAANPEKYLAAQRKAYYGITPEQAAALMASQGGKCAICETSTPNGRGAWHLDHDHKTGAVRNFLCQACNSGLGFFRDDADRLTTAAQYLRKHQNGR